MCIAKRVIFSLCQRNVQYVCRVRMWMLAKFLNWFLLIWHNSFIFLLKLLFFTYANLSDGCLRAHYFAKSLVERDLFQTLEQHRRFPEVFLFCFDRVKSPKQQWEYSRHMGHENWAVSRRKGWWGIKADLLKRRGKV